MNNVENISIKILEIINEKQNYDNKYNNILLSFITKAYELVDLSEDLYQVEHTIRLNKISLKDYILSSDLCNALKDNNINNYSITELRKYMNKYEIKNIGNISSYRLALDLYETLEELEILENEKIEYEISKLSNIFNDIARIKLVNKESFQELYNKISLKVKEKYLDNNIIDDKIYNYIIQILNDIFYYYLYGPKKIPIDK